MTNRHRRMLSMAGIAFVLLLTAPSADAQQRPTLGRIEAVMWREKKMFANLDYYTAVIYRMCGLPTHLFPTLFLIARSCGLVAHITEQRAHNRLIHPSSKFIGTEPREFTPMEKRG